MSTDANRARRKVAKISDHAANNAFGGLKPVENSTGHPLPHCPPDELALYAQELGNADETRFISTSPEKALQWICTNAPREALLKYIKNFYKTALAGSSSAPTHRAKRTKRTNEKSPEPSDLLQRFQDYAYEHIDALPEEQRKLALKGSIVAGELAINDWRELIRAWREVKSTGESLFWEPGQTAIVGCDEAISSGQGVWNEVIGAEALRTGYLAVTQFETKTLARTIQYRRTSSWVYQKLEERRRYLEHNNVTSGESGRGRATLAKDALFTEMYPRLCQGGDRHYIKREDYPAESQEMEKVIRYGKKWNILEEKFGVGIFALMPPSQLSNTWVQRLSMPHFMAWVEMVLHCNPYAHEACVLVEDWLLPCLLDHEPPSHKLQLELDNCGVPEEYKGGREICWYLTLLDPEFQGLDTGHKARLRRSRSHISNSSEEDTDDNDSSSPKAHVDTSSTPRAEAI